MVFWVNYLENQGNRYYFAPLLNSFMIRPVDEQPWPSGNALDSD